MKRIDDLWRLLNKLEKKKTTPSSTLEIGSGFSVNNLGDIFQNENTATPADSLILICKHSSRNPDSGGDLRDAIEVAKSGSEDALRALCEFTAIRKGIASATKYVNRKLGREAAETFRDLFRHYLGEIDNLNQERQSKRRADRKRRLK